MNSFSIRVLALAMISTALVAAPVVSAYAAGGDNPSPPASGTKDKKKDNKGSSIDDPKFLKGYRTAYTTIFGLKTLTPSGFIYSSRRVNIASSV